MSDLTPQQLELAGRSAELLGRFMMSLSVPVVLGGYRLYLAGLTHGGLPLDETLVLGGIASILVATLYSGLVQSDQRPSWGRSMVAFGGLIPYAYCIFVIAYVGGGSLLTILGHGLSWGSFALAVAGPVLGYAALYAFWQITELPNAKPAQPATPMPSGERIGEIIQAFGAVIEKAPPSIEIRDVSELPFPKLDIKIALMMALGSPAIPDQMREGLRGSMMCLAQFQPGVGPRPLWPNGIDLEAIRQASNGDGADGLALAQLIADAKSQAGAAAYARLISTVEAEQKELADLIERILTGRLSTARSA